MRRKKVTIVTEKGQKYGVNCSHPLIYFPTVLKNRESIHLVHTFDNFKVKITTYALPLQVV